MMHPYDASKRTVENKHNMGLGQMQGCMETKKLLWNGTNDYCNPDVCLLDEWEVLDLRVLYHAGKLKTSQDFGVDNIRA